MNDDPTDTAAPAAPRVKRGLPTALIVVASLLAFLAILAIWANRQLLNTDNWTQSSSELLQKESVRNQVADFLVNELYANVDVQGQIESALPPRAAPLAGPAAGGLKDLADRGANALLQTPRAQQLWENANRTAHKQLLKVLEGGGDVVSTTNGEVTLDLQALLGQTAGRVGVASKLSQRIPPDAGDITILRSDQLALAQDAVRALKAIAVILLVLSLALFALAVYLAQGWRREAIRACGIGFIFAGAVALIARSLGGDAIVDSLATTEAVRPAIADTWTVATSLLVEAAVATIAYGVVIVIAAWLAGPTSVAVALRRELAPYLRDSRIAYGTVGAIVLLVIAWGPTPATRNLIGILLLIVLLVAGMEALRRQVAREHPDASRERSGERMRSWLGDASERMRGGAPQLRPSRAAAGSGTTADDRLAQLERLGKLRDSGVLDAEEFAREKARIVGD